MRSRASAALLAALALAGCHYTRIGGSPPEGVREIFLHPVSNRTMPYSPGAASTLDRALADELVARGYRLSGPAAASTLHVSLDNIRESTLVQDADGERRDGSLTVTLTVAWSGAEGSLLDGGVPSITVRIRETFSIAIGESALAAQREAFRQIAPRVIDLLRSKQWNPTLAVGNEPEDDEEPPWMDIGS